MYNVDFAQPAGNPVDHTILLNQIDCPSVVGPKNKGRLLLLKAELKRIQYSLKINEATGDQYTVQQWATKGKFLGRKISIDMDKSHGKNNGTQCVIGNPQG